MTRLLVEPAPRALPRAPGVDGQGVEHHGQAGQATEGRLVLGAGEVGGDGGESRVGGLGRGGQGLASEAGSALLGCEQHNSVKLGKQRVDK